MTNKKPKNLDEIGLISLIIFLGLITFLFLLTILINGFNNSTIMFAIFYIIIVFTIIIIINKVNKEYQK